MITLFNKGKRVISGYHKDQFDDKNKPITYNFGPEKTMSFHEEDANKIKRLFPKEVLSLEDVKKQFDEKVNPVVAPTSITIEESEKVKDAAVKAAVEAERDKIRAEIMAEQQARLDAQDKQSAGPDPLATQNNTPVASALVDSIKKFVK